jgi:hypothetical protein
MKIQCRIKDCPSVIEVLNATENTKYLCSKHTVSKNEVRFQDIQFDSELNNSFTPQGTNHIQHQGSEAWKAEDIARALSRAK